jgi:hypothetical protein
MYKNDGYVALYSAIRCVDVIGSLLKCDGWLAKAGVAMSSDLHDLRLI